MFFFVIYLYHSHYYLCLLHSTSVHLLIRSIHTNARTLPVVLPSCVLPCAICFKHPPRRRIFNMKQGCSTPHRTTPHHTAPHRTTPHHATPHHTTPHRTTPRHITPRHITPYHATTTENQPQHQTTSYTWGRVDEQNIYKFTTHKKPQHTKDYNTQRTTTHKGLQHTKDHNTQRTTTHRSYNTQELQHTGVTTQKLQHEAFEARKTSNCREGCTRFLDECLEIVL